MNSTRFHRIAVFASGNGSNAQRIVEHFVGHPSVAVRCIIYNRKEAYVARRAALLGVEARYFSKADFEAVQPVMDYLRECDIDFIVLAGFLLKVPKALIEHYVGHIVNIHPALLPKYGGKGMYGQRVHEAVIADGESESGITIHLVNEHYDSGDILFQARCDVAADDTPASLAEKVHELEAEHFPRVIEHWIDEYSR